MWIIVGCLFFSLAFFLNSAESRTVTLKDLFPETNGEELPPVKTFPYVETRQLSNLRRVIGPDMIKFDTKSNLVARRHLIIGWKERDVIEPLSNLFGETNNVFDTYTNTFESLTAQELDRLGVHRRLSYVRKEDELESEEKASQRLNFPENHPEKHRANIHAIYHAYYVASRQPNANHAVDHQAKLQALRDAYYNSYNQTNQHVLGEYLHKYGRTK